MSPGIALTRPREHTHGLFLAHTRPASSLSTLRRPPIIEEVLHSGPVCLTGLDGLRLVETAGEHGELLITLFVLSINIIPCGNADVRLNQFQIGQIPQVEVTTLKF